MSAKKLREAVEAVYESAEDGVLVIRESAFEKVLEALAEPVRNYEVGTAEEQEKRFSNFCDTHYNINDENDACSSCPLNDNIKISCEFTWMQTPYKEVEQ